MRFLKYIFIIAMIFLMGGCARVATQISGATQKYESKNGMSSSNNHQQCHQWCHNGWCSTHCDPVSGN